MLQTCNHKNVNVTHSRLDVQSPPGGTAPPIMARPPNLAVPQIAARPPNLAVLLTHRGQLILRKISIFDATRCQILRLKCTKFDFHSGSAQTPLVELTALSQPP